ncbi:protein FAM163B [Eudromia elegans]
MTAGTVVITGGILATVILLCIIAVLCYCRLQYYCCKKDESEEDEEEPDFAVHSHVPPLHCNRNVVLSNGPALLGPAAFGAAPGRPAPACPGCAPFEPPTFFLQEPDDDDDDDDEELPNGGERVSYGSEEGLQAPAASAAALQALNPNRLSAMREAFSRSRSISTDV